MPLYEYQCRDCEERFEVLQPIGADASRVECPACAGAAIDKLLSAFATSTSNGAEAACTQPGCGSGFT